MLTFDLRAFEAAAQGIGAAIDQVPFAISKTLNNAALKTQKRLATETWAQHTANRDKQFLHNALQVEFSSKRTLRVSNYDRLRRAPLAEHVKGGTVRGRGNLAIPTKRVARTAKGIRPSQKPGNLKRSMRKGDLIFQATGKGKNQRLQLMFKLQPSYRIKKDVPLVEDLGRFMREEVRRKSRTARAKAMRTKR